jgi:uncharacterized protein YraI
LTAAIIVLTAVMPFIATPHAAKAASTAVTTDYLNLRSGPRTDMRIRAVMPPGETVQLLGDTRRGFYKISWRGQPGWAHGDYLDFSGGSSGGSSSGGNNSGGGSALPQGSGGGSATVTSALNLRAAPSTGAAIILVMPGGATVELTGDSDNGFLGVIYNGNRGWGHSDYLRTGSGGSSGSGDDDDGGGGSSLPQGSGGGSATVDSSLNLRTAPNTGASVIAVMPGGAVVELTGDSANGFLGVIYNGNRGWAHGDYLSSGGSSGGGDDGGSSGGDGGSSGGWDGSDGWSQDEIIAIIYAAADEWGLSRSDMLRVARCESGLDPYQVTPPYSASGLFQFLPSTWASTPYAGDDIFDPVANANATGWMWTHGRRGEWVCQ